jgi:predicted dehydrogenase
MDQVGVGIISFEHFHAISYASAFNQIRECRLVGVADPDSRRGKEMAAVNSTRFMSVEELLADESISAVCIGSANARHRKDVELAAEAGKNVMVEKPIATTIEDAEHMIAKCKKEDVFLQVAFVMRYSPIALEAKAAIESGSVGEIQAISGTNHGSMPGNWFIDRDLSGGGAILDHTVHVADLMNWYLGSRARRVYALGGNRLYPGLGIDDSGFVLIQYDSAACSIDPSWSRPKGHPIWGDARLRIFGSEGTLEIDGFNQNIGLTRSGERLNLIGYGSDVDLYTCRDLVESTMQDREPRSTGQDGLAALEIALGAYESIATGGPVDLPLS